MCIRDRAPFGPLSAGPCGSGVSNLWRTPGPGEDRSALWRGSDPQHCPAGLCSQGQMGSDKWVSALPA
eukprot:8425198-Alexandrium_andersonii.AAC.1